MRPGAGPEGVLGGADQELVLCHIAHHGVRPMEHGRPMNCDGLRTGGECIPGPDELEGPLRGIEEPVERLLAPVGDVDRCLRVSSMIFPIADAWSFSIWFTTTLFDTAGSTRPRSCRSYIR